MSSTRSSRQLLLFNVMIMKLNTKSEWTEGLMALLVKHCMALLMALLVKHCTALAVALLVKYCIALTMTLSVKYCTALPMALLVKYCLTLPMVLLLKYCIALPLSLEKFMTVNGLSTGVGPHLQSSILYPFLSFPFL